VTTLQQPEAMIPPHLSLRLLNAPGRIAAPVLAVLVSLAVSACQMAQDNPLKSTARAAGFATNTPEPQEFVRESRRNDQSFIPVGTSASRQAPKMTPQEFQAIEKDLDAQRTRNEAAGASARAAGATPPPAPLKLPPPL
jgi:hypothetical protein